MSSDVKLFLEVLTDLKEGAWVPLILSKKIAEGRNAGRAIKKPGQPPPPSPTPPLPSLG